MKRFRTHAAASAARPLLEPLERRQLLAQTPFDPTFGSAGRTHIDIAGLFDSADLVRPQNDGSLLLSGRTATPAAAPDAVPPYVYSNFLIRLAADGAPVTAFADGGIRLLNDLVTRQLQSVRALATDANGRILVAGLAPAPASQESSGGDDGSASEHTGGNDDNNGSNSGSSGSGGSSGNSGSNESGNSGSGGSDNSGNSGHSGGSNDGGSSGNGSEDNSGSGSSDDRRLRRDFRPAAAGRESAAADVNLGFAVYRFNPDGSIDSTFGQSGAAVFDVARGSTESLTALTIDADGKIVVAGTATPSGDSGNSGSGSGQSVSPMLIVARLTSDGALDAGFGAAGIQISVLPAVSSLYSDANHADTVVAQPDGRLLVGGRSSYRPQSNSGQGNAQSHAVAGVTLARYNGDGSEDNTFGDGGSAFVPLAYDTQGDAVADDAAPSRLLVQADGHIIASAPTEGGDAVGILRFTSNGALDSAFGSAGRVVRPGVADGDYAVRQLNEAGELELAGVARSPSSAASASSAGDAFASRLNPSGAVIDERRQSMLFDSTRETPLQADFTADGKIVAVGSVAAAPDAGEGEAVEQSKDVLVFRLDTAALQNPAVQPPGDEPPTPTPQPPPAPQGQVKFAGKGRVSGGRVFNFKVNYSNASDAQDTLCLIVFPGGTAQAASVVKSKAAKNGTAQVAYRFVADDGKFDMADNGYYEVRYESTAGALIGGFNVSSKAAPSAATPRGQAAIASLADAAGRLGVKPKMLSIESVSTAVFADSSLGYPRAGEVYGAAVTPGFVIMVVSKTGNRIEYHADSAGHVRGPG